ncbi:ATP-dependent DNA helicase PIF1 [Glycine soja]
MAKENHSTKDKAGKSLEREESKEFSDCVVLNSLTREKGDTKEFRRIGSSIQLYELVVLSNFMARIPDKINSIDGSKEALKLVVRITDLWFVGTPNKSKQAKMVIVDFEGDQIHVVCKADQLKCWKANLKENSTYVMHNFKVVKNDGQFRVCEHEYKLVFIGVTVVKEADLHQLPFKEFRFVEFGNVVGGNFVADIIGVVDQVLFRHVSSKNTRFLAYLNECGNDGSIVIILTHARIKDAQGSYPALVSNSFKTSKLLINEHVLEIQEFRERLLDLGVEVSPVLAPGDQGSSQLSWVSQLSSNDAFLSKVEAKTISEINGISEDVVCVMVGTISKIVMDSHSWCYPACIQCHRKTDIETGPFTCECGKDNDQPVLRYRVEVMDGDVDLNASPQALDRLLGYVRIQSKFRNVVVLRYSNELDLINVVLDMLADTEACSKIDASNVDCNNATHPECQSLSVIADHDPIAGFPLTLKKRLSSDEVDDELGSSQISPAQLSFNKLTRHFDKIIVSDSSESVNSESTQGSNFLTAYEDCQSPTNHPVINTEGYFDLSDQLMQCRYCNAQIQYSRIQGHIVSSLSHMLDEHNSHAKSFRMARDKLTDDEADNIKLQLIAAQGKDGHVYNMPNVPEIVALIVGDFHPSSKRDIIVETQNGELQRIHELHPSYLPLQYLLLFPYGEDGYRVDIRHRSTSSNKKRKQNRLTMRKWFAYRLQSRSNEAMTLLHSRKLFQQFIVEGYIMVESERLSYIRNNQKKLRVDKYCSLQNSLDTGTTKGLTKGKRVILPSTFVGSPRYMDQLYFDGMAMCSHVGFPNLFITLTCNPNWLEIRRLLSPLNLKPTDRPDIVSRIFILKYEQMLSDLTNGQLLGKVVACNLPINANEQKTIYNKIIQVVNNNEGEMFFLYGFGGTGKTFIWRTFASSLRADNQIVIIVASSGIASLLLPGGRTALSRFKIPVPIFEDSTCNIHQGIQLAELLNQTSKNIGLGVYIPRMSMSPSQSPWPFKPLRRQFPIMLSYAMTINKSQGQSLSMVGLYLPKPVFTHGQLYVALSRVNSAKGLKIMIHDNEQKSMNSTTNVMKYPIIRPPSIMQFKAAFHNDQTFIEIPAFYHQQWAPNYPESVQLRYNGATYQIQLQQHWGRCFLADGLTDFRANLKTYESIIIKFFVCDDNSIFDTTTSFSSTHLDRRNNSMYPRWSSSTVKHLNECGNHMPILRKHGPPLQWKVVTLDAGIKDKSIVRPWYNFLKENDFHHGDEVSFYYQPHEKIWEIVIRRQRKTKRRNIKIKTQRYNKNINFINREIHYGGPSGLDILYQRQSYCLTFFLLINKYYSFYSVNVHYVSINCKQSLQEYKDFQRNQIKKYKNLTARHHPRTKMNPSFPMRPHPQLLHFARCCGAMPFDRIVTEASKVAHEKLHKGRVFSWLVSHQKDARRVKIDNGSRSAIATSTFSLFSF